MNDKNRTEYAKSLYAMIHTISGKSAYIIDYVEPEVATAVKSCNTKKVRNKDEFISYLQLNLNKYIGDNYTINSYTEYMQVLEDVLNGCGIKTEDFTINRCDIAINSNNSEHYEKYKKLNKLLICCLADRYSFSNCYQTFDLWNYASLNCAIKNDFYEIENYNKDIETDGKSEVKNRLELRSKRLTDNDLEHEFCFNWSKKLNDAIENFENVQQRYNDNLVQMYFEDKQKPKDKQRYMTVNSFILQYQDSIFTTKQLTELMERLGVPDAEIKAKNFKRYHKPEFYSKRDLMFIVDAINKKIEDFFRG